MGTFFIFLWKQVNVTALFCMQSLKKTGTMSVNSPTHTESGSYRTTVTAHIGGGVCFSIPKSEEFSPRFYIWPNLQVSEVLSLHWSYDRQQKCNKVFLGPDYEMDNISPFGIESFKFKFNCRDF